MTYITEFKVNWRPLVGAFLGLGAGLGYTATTASVFAPPLLAEFGWSKAQFALTHSLILVMLVAIPLAGRLTDTVGVRRTALIGVISLPITFFAFSMMTGDIRQYLGLYVIQSFLCATTSATVYSRVIVDHFKNARGLALAIGASGPALMGMSLTPFLNEFIAAYGWRAGYQVLTLFTLVGGSLALLLIPAHPRTDKQVARQPRRNREVYGAIARMRIFWLLLIAIFLCNMPQVLSVSQLNLVLLDNGMSGSIISFMLSAASTGILMGRFLCGIALDRFPLPVVAGVGLGLPTIGLILIASPYDAPWALTLGVFILGFSYGAEGDLLGYIVARIFGLAIYSTVLGIVSATISVAIATGATILSLTLGATGTFALYLCIAAGATLVGSIMLFLLLGRREKQAATEGRTLAPAFD